MARFQIPNENDAAARKSFTLQLRDEGPGGSAGPVSLLAGQSKTYGAYVEKNWTWGLETSAGFPSRSFYDWDLDRDFTNKDGRTANAFGVEGRPAWDARAGFQVDHLSTASSRPAATRYAFETANAWGGGWVSIKLTDTFSVEAKAMRAHPASSLPDFNVGLLKGNTVVPTSDIQREYPMSLSGLPQQPVIQRQFQAGDLLQNPSDKTAGGKVPFAVVTMVAKTRALQANRFYEAPALPSDSLYDLRFDAMSDFGQVDAMGSSDILQDGFKVTGVERKGNQLFLDFMAAPDVFGLGVVGTDSLTEGFHDDLNDATIAIPGPPGTGIYKLIVDVTGKGPNYYVRIEGEADP